MGHILITNEKKTLLYQKKTTKSCMHQHSIWVNKVQLNHISIFYWARVCFQFYGDKNWS